MAHARILVVDQEQGQEVGNLVLAILGREQDCRVDLAARPASAGQFAIIPQIVIPVLPAARQNAETLMAELRFVLPSGHLLPVVHPQTLCELSDGVLGSSDDFFLIPLRESEVRARVRKFLLKIRAGLARPFLDLATGAFELAGLIGEDPVFLELKRKIPLIAAFDSTVLITGETGTGKERCARALHYLSPRAGMPFLPVNCGAIPPELFESEIYGRLKGAFTGALASQHGLVAEAEGGTLFLDEIETLSLGSQVKLLRFLQDQTYHSVGSPKARQANVRIIASTNLELPRMIQEGNFRSDLFYRLAVITLALPPLRQRRTDIPLLVAHFWKLFETKTGRAGFQLSTGALQALCDYPWPGNVRELENIIQQILVSTEVQTVQQGNLPIPQRRSSIEPSPESFKHAKARAIETFERAYVEELIQIHRGNVTHAAEQAKKDRRAFGRLMTKYQIAKH